MNTPLYDQASAPQDSQPLLANSVQAFGRIPNLHAVMAESPNVLEAYQLLHELFQNSSFDKDGITVVWQTINVEHACHYCVAAHTAIAKMMKVDETITTALREKTEMPTAKLQVLHETTLELVRERGHLSEQSLNTFFAAGYNKRHLLEIVLGISQKVLSNYTNHLMNTPVDSAFEAFSWE